MSHRYFGVSGFAALIWLLTGTWTEAESPADKPPTTQPAVTPGVAMNQGGMEVRIKEAYIDQLPLRRKSTGKAMASEATDEGLVSNDKFLILELEITNNGKETLDYFTVNGAGEKYDPASVIEGPKHFLTLALFGELEPLEMTAKATLKPGDKVKDVVAFVPPKDSHAHLQLILSSRNLGNKGKVIIPFTIGRVEKDGKDS